MRNRLLIGCIVVLFTSGCGIFKDEKPPEKTTDRTEKRKSEKEDKEKKEKEEVAEEKKDTTGVKTEETAKKEMDSVLNISVLLPFGSEIPNVNEDTTSDEDEETDLFSGRQEAVFSFYLGLKLGLEEIHDQGIGLKTKVVNTSDWSGGSRGFLNDEEVISADVWIGGYDMERLKTLSVESAARSALFVSPFLTTSYFIESNPYYFQMKPSFAMHCRAIAKDVLDRYDPANVTLVVKDAIRNRYSFFKDSIENKAAQQFNELSFPSHEEIEDWTIEGIEKGDTAVFILPVYKDKGFVYTFLSHLSLNLPEDVHTVIYGVPPWNKFELLYEFFDRFTVRMSSAHYEHSSNPFRLQSFVEQYINRYGTLPAEESWEGYDLAHFLGSSFKERKNPLSEKLEDLYMQGLSMEFIPTAEMEKKQSIFDFSNRPKYFYNAGVYILEFRDHTFRLINR